MGQSSAHGTAVNITTGTRVALPNKQYSPRYCYVNGIVMNDIMRCLMTQSLI